MAAPVTQLFTQAHLIEVEGKPVQAKDVLAVAKLLVRGRLIRKAGVEKIDAGKTGD